MNLNSYIHARTDLYALLCGLLVRKSDSPKYWMGTLFSKGMFGWLLNGADLESHGVPWPAITIRAVSTGPVFLGCQGGSVTRQHAHSQVFEFSQKRERNSVLLLSPLYCKVEESSETRARWIESISTKIFRIVLLRAPSRGPSLLVGVCPSASVSTSLCDSFKYPVFQSVVYWMVCLENTIPRPWLWQSSFWLSVSDSQKLDGNKISTVASWGRDSFSVQGGITRFSLMWLLLGLFADICCTNVLHWFNLLQSGWHYKMIKLPWFGIREWEGDGNSHTARTWKAVLQFVPDTTVDSGVFTSETCFFLKRQTVFPDRVGRQHAWMCLRKYQCCCTKVHICFVLACCQNSSKTMLSCVSLFLQALPRDNLWESFHLCDKRFFNWLTAIVLCSNDIGLEAERTVICGFGETAL